MPEHLATSELIRLGQEKRCWSEMAFFVGPFCMVLLLYVFSQSVSRRKGEILRHPLEPQAPEIVVPAAPREPQSSEEPWWTNAKLPGEPRR